MNFIKEIINYYGDDVIKGYTLSSLEGARRAVEDYNNVSSPENKKKVVESLGRLRVSIAQYTSLNDIYKEIFECANKELVKMLKDMRNVKHR